MPRTFCIPGVFFLLAATVLLIITSVSLPFLTGVDIVRTHFDQGHPNALGDQDALSQIRFGIWGHCDDNVNKGRTCFHERAYTVAVNTKDNHRAEIRSAWTRGLAIHPVAAGASFIALLLSLSTHLTVTLLASLVSFLAAAITVIAFAIDIALLALTRHEMNNLDIGAKTITGPGFWLTFVALILLLLAGCTVCFGRRRDRANSRFVGGGAGTTTAYPVNTSPRRPFWKRFGRNKY